MATYNYFRRSGQVVEDPRVVVWLKEYPDRKLGDHRGDMTPREAAETLYMRILGVTFGNVKDKVTEDEPVVVAEIDGERREYDAVTGDRLDE